MTAILERLRNTRMEDRVPLANPNMHGAPYEELLASGVKVVSSSPELEQQYYRGWQELFGCLRRTPDGRLVLFEGNSYDGCWIESTGTINVERLGRFLPQVSEDSYELFAAYQREDGLIPFRVTPEGGDYSHLQIVTPLARCVWNHYLSTGKNKTFLLRMYTAMEKFDEWVARHRDTRGTGGVEAFCTWDTGHDLSPRFWGIPDITLNRDAAQCWDNPFLPLIAPDMTANIYAQRQYLALIARELGLPHEQWEQKAEQSYKALMEQCYDEADQFFYDRDRNGNFIRIQSDNLLRVLACEVGDHAYFKAMLEKYLLNTRKFFARYPLTSIAMDDPRFERDFSYNNWGGGTNLLTLIRTPHAFERFGHHVELTWITQPMLFACIRMHQFAQTVSPWTGHGGFSDGYSPAMLTMFDFLERICGILPTEQGELWFTGLTPYGYEGGSSDFGSEMGYSRMVDGTEYEFVVVGNEATIYADRELIGQFPKGIRLITDRSGELKAIVGMTLAAVEGTVTYKGQQLPFVIKGNEVQACEHGRLVTVHDPGIVMPRAD